MLWSIQPQFGVRENQEKDLYCFEIYFDCWTGFLLLQCLPETGLSGEWICKYYNCASNALSLADFLALGELLSNMVSMVSTIIQMNKKYMNKASTLDCLYII